MAEANDEIIGTDNSGGNGTGSPAGNSIDSQAADGNPTGGGDQTKQPELPEGFELIKTEDKQNLIKARDKNHTAATQGGDQVTELYGAVDDLMKREVVRDMAAKYPDVPKEILENASDPQSMEEQAKAWQAHSEKVKQEALASLQQVTQPEMSQDERAAKLEKAKKDGDFEAMVGLRTPKNF